MNATCMTYAPLAAPSEGIAIMATPFGADPSIVFFGQLEALSRELDTVETWEAEQPVLERYNLLCARIEDGTFPKPITTEGAVKVLRRALVGMEFLEAQERYLIEAALAFLDPPDLDELARQHIEGVERAAA